TKELFIKDKVDNDNQGFDALFLGTKSKTKTFSYKGVERTVNTKHEGIRGIRLSQHLSGTGTTEFWDSTENKWSLNAWLSKYRTLDDNGTRLTLGNGTGSLITSSNINSIDVCKPTHVVIALGMNDGGTLAQYKQMIDTIRAEFPEVIIGIVVMPVAGTYFPSLHPNCSPNSIFWNNHDNIISKRNQQYNLLKMLQENYPETEEENNVYVIPFFHTAPTAESIAGRKSNLPDADYSSALGSQHFEHFGWGANIHTNGLGHINWGYQLYSWIKWTIAKFV
ncbi:SGNH/GDSL hydrolase family protein, partial [Acinetobacter sp. ANC 5380]